MSDDGVSILEVVLGIGLLALVIGFLVGAPGAVKPDRSMLPGYTPVELALPDWNQIPTGERTAFGITNAENKIVMIVTGTRDKRGVCAYFVEEAPTPSKDEIIAGILTNPKETASRIRLIAGAEACYGLYPHGIGEAPEVLSVNVSNVSDKPILYSPHNFYFRQNQRAVPIAGYRLLGQEKFMLGGVLSPGESILGCVLVRDMLNLDRAFEFWYGHNYGIIEDF